MIPQEVPAQTNVPIAATITAYSRMIINQYKLDAMSLGLEVYYSDTDSLVVNGPLPPKYIDDTELGLLKLEHEIEEAYFVAPRRDLRPLVGGPEGPKIDFFKTK